MGREWSPRKQVEDLTSEKWGRGAALTGPGGGRAHGTDADKCLVGVAVVVWCICFPEVQR